MNKIIPLLAMLISFHHAGKDWQCDTDQPFDLSNPVEKNGHGVSAYHIPDATFTPFEAGSFVGSMELGGACNCETVSFCAHGNGTHTENASHVIAGANSIHHMQWSGLMPARLISLEPVTLQNGDQIITQNALEQKLKELRETALIVRTLPNSTEKKGRQYSGTNPPYFEANALKWLMERGVQHLLYDGPSVDREEDGGKLSAHKNFFTQNGEIRNNASITELIFVNDLITDGLYLLNLQLPSMHTDAVPSRPLLYPLK